MKKIPSLDGLRAVSICFVLLAHLNAGSNNIFKNIPDKTHFNIITLFITNGNLGVNIFFAISGFLITSLLINELNKNGSISLKNFFIRRTLRIFPAYFFLLAVYYILQLSGIIYIKPASWLTALTYTKYFNTLLDWNTGHTWSLSVEEHFYLLWPFLFIVSSKTRKYGALFLLLTPPIFRIYAHYHQLPYMTNFSIFQRIDAIAIGCLIAMYKEKTIQLLSNHWNLYFYSSIFTLIFIRFLPQLLQKLGIDLDLFFIAFGNTHGTIGNISICIILMYSVYGPKNLWHTFLNMKAISYIGTLSYSIYLWQQLFINPAKTHWFNQTPTNVIFSFLCALFSFYLIEKPFLKIKSKFSTN